MSIVALGKGEEIAATISARLPQPDQLCGPFVARAVLEALTGKDPGLAAVAAAAQTRVWPHDLPASRPAGVPSSTTGWEGITLATSADDSGTHAAGVARAVEQLSDGELVVVPATGSWTAPTLAALIEMLQASHALGAAIANIGTRALHGPGWDVGHFAVVSGVAAPSGHFAFADSYAELGHVGLPPGTHLQSVDRVVAALSGPDRTRGLLLIGSRDNAETLHESVRDVGLECELWNEPA